MRPVIGRYHRSTKFVCLESLEICLKPLSVEKYSRLWTTITYMQLKFKAWLAV